MVVNLSSINYEYPMVLKLKLFYAYQVGPRINTSVDTWTYLIFNEPLNIVDKPSKPIR